MNKNAIAIIPARGGSKRIPGKNIKDFLGKPIIGYSIQTALQSNLFDMVMVSTDDEEIVEVAGKFGAEVPFLRSKKNSDDFAGTVDVLNEVLNELVKNGKRFENVCCIYPAAPFVTIQVLTDAFNLMVKNNYDSVFPVCPFSSPLLRALRINSENKVEMIWPENKDKRSQDLPQSFYDAGQFYWFTTAGFINTQQILTDNSGAIILDEFEAQDIDSITDWKLAEIKYGLIHNIK